jgi:hypothetical protein
MSWSHGLYVAANAIGVGLLLTFAWLGQSNLRKARSISRMALLEPVTTQELFSGTEDEWPAVGRRWPRPGKHDEELNDDVRRQAYATFARQRARSLAFGSEVALIAAGASWGYTIPTGISEIFSKGPDSFVPDKPEDIPMTVLSLGFDARWQSALVFTVVVIAMRVRDESKALERLATMYDGYRQ